MYGLIEFDLENGKHFDSKVMSNDFPLSQRVAMAQSIAMREGSEITKLTYTKE